MQHRDFSQIVNRADFVCHPSDRQRFRAKRRWESLLYGACPLNLRKRVREAFNSRCEYCGIQCVSAPAVPARKEGESTNGHWHTVDRIVPAAERGRYIADNVTSACVSCNCSRKRAGGFIGPVRSLADMEAAQ